MINPTKPIGVRQQIRNPAITLVDAMVIRDRAQKFESKGAKQRIWNTYAKREETEREALEAAAKKAAEVKKSMTQTPKHDNSTRSSKRRARLAA